MQNAMESIKKHVFTPTEKKLYLDILKKYSHIVENRNTDGAALVAKKKAWNKLAAEYNASPQVAVQVTSVQLRRLWMNLKQRQKVKERRHLMFTRRSRDPLQMAPAIYCDTIKESDVKEEIFDESSNVTCENTTSPILTTSPLPPSTPSPPLISTSLPPPTSTEFQPLKNSIQNGYVERSRRINELHALEVRISKEKLKETIAKADLDMLILKEKLREAKAKADLAELLLQRQCHPSVLADTEVNDGMNASK